VPMASAPPAYSTSLWSICALTSAHLPVKTDEHEVDVFVDSHVALNEEKDKRVVLRLTTLRLVLLFSAPNAVLTHCLAPTSTPSSFPTAISLSLAHVKKVEAHGGGLRSTPKVTLSLGDHHAPLTVRCSSTAAQSSILSSLNSCIRSARETLRTRQARAASQRTSLSATHAGIGGLQRRQEAKFAAHTEALERGLSGSMEQLCTMAESLVSLAEEVAAARRREGLGNDDASSSSRSPLAEALASAGFVTSGSKATLGDEYLDELSRQLADWIVRSALPLHKGVMLVTDAFCVFNRARGAQAVSATDFRGACERFAALNLPVALHVYSSGVMVIRDAKLTTAKVNEQIAALLRDVGKITALQYATRASISLMIANENLHAAERAGVVCRDETIDAVTFYPNFFASLP